MRQQAERTDLLAGLPNSPGQRSFLQDNEYRQDTLQRLSENCPEAALSLEIGKGLLPLLHGEANVEDLLAPGSVLHEFYQSPILSMSYEKVARYVALLAHKNAGLRVIDINAGSGAATEWILNALMGCKDGPPTYDNGIPRFSEYTFTNKSAVSENVKSHFGDCSGRLSYASFDVERDPLAQGFEEERYDMAVCSLV